MRIPDDIPDEVTSKEAARLLGGVTMRTATACLNAWGYEPMVRYPRRSGCLLYTSPSPRD